MSARLLIAVFGLMAVSASAQETGEGDELVVWGRAIRQAGIAHAASEGTVGYRDFENRPWARVGELAETVPGLIATQHSGTGKANQFFLRGFNLDHGTDLAGHVDGAPVNMRSHGHGQGYLDLNFIIPELVERIDFAKGPYRADAGDFAAAGTMRMQTRDSLPAPMVEVTGGSWGYWRALTAGSGTMAGGTLLAGLEGTVSNGPWVLDEDLQKVNALFKWSKPGFSIGLSAYAARWNSTDQVPERAIASGLIPRLGFIDPDLGGGSGRYAVTVQGGDDVLRWNAYAIRSVFSLTSNFTYFLAAPVDGDQFIQRDRRWIVGGSLAWRRQLSDSAVLRLGGEARADLIGRVGLYNASNGSIRATVREDSLDQASVSTWGEVEVKLSPTVRAIAGLRADMIGYDVKAGIKANGGSGNAAIITPKASLAWQAIDGVEFYAGYGEGFHSNDVRGATISFDPASGDPAERVAVFVRACGAEFGVRVEREQLTFTAAAFWLQLQSELVFVGDGGTTEPNGATRRFGAEATLFWRPVDALTIDAALALTDGRFVGTADNRIPGSVGNVLSAGASWLLRPDLVLTARVRHFGAAPLIEDGSARSEPSTLVNAGAYWTIGRIRLSGEILNLTNARAPDISYFYASRLPGEHESGVEDRHIHPLEPRQFRLSARFSF